MSKILSIMRRQLLISFLTLSKNLKVNLNHQFKLKVKYDEIKDKYEELKARNERESHSDKFLNSNEPDHYPGLPNQYHLPTRSWGYDHDQEPEHTRSPNDNAFSWGKRSSLPYEDNHSTWSRRNLDGETRIGSSADPSIILLTDSNGKVLNPRIFKRGETVIKCDCPTLDTLRDQINRINTSPKQILIHVGTNYLEKCGEETFREKYEEIIEALLQKIKNTSQHCYFEVISIIIRF